jgi:hypothetical protein
MTTKILFRASLAEEHELTVAQRFFSVIHDRANMQTGDLIIPRYSVLPYPEELERDAAILGAKLINTTKQHRYVADLQNWYYDFEDYTPKTWFRLEEIEGDGPFVLKGATNSRKANWRTMMFAPTRADVPRILDRLLDDPLISSQGIYARQFEPFTQFELHGLNGLPVTNEWRFFILDREILARGFYWSEHFEEVFENTDQLGAAYDGADFFVKKTIAPRLNKIRFVVADVAEREDGTWRLVELNDGCQSGLSCVDPEVLYSELKTRFT